MNECLKIFKKEKSCGNGSRMELTRELSPLQDWSKKYVPVPERVHRASLLFQENGEERFRFGIGKGGQVYSVQANGEEYMPPQHHYGAPWIDEVFQIVATCKQICCNSERETNKRTLFHFIHQAGTYYINPQCLDPLEPELLDYPFYSPMLAEEYDEDEQSYSCIVWGQQAHIPTVHRSDVVYYQKLRYLGDGVVKCTHIIHNFGPVELNNFNFPWGGTRTSSLPYSYYIDENGKKIQVDTTFFESVNVKQRKDVGIFGWSKTADESSDAFGLILPGKDSCFEDNGVEIDARVGMGDTMQFRKPETQARIPWQKVDLERNYNVFVNAYNFPLKEDETFEHSFLYVMGNTQKQREAAKRYADEIGFGFRRFQKEDWPSYSYRKEGVKTNGLDNDLYAVPVAGTKPVYLLRDTQTGERFLSQDLYCLCTKIPYDSPLPKGHRFYEMYQNRILLKPYDGKTEFLEIAGYHKPLK